METEKNADNAKKYNCGICDFECYKKSNYNSHLLTRKHKKRANGNQMETMETDLVGFAAFSSSQWSLFGFVCFICCLIVF